MSSASDFTIYEVPDYEGAYVARLVFSVVILITATGLCCAACFQARRRHDPARSGMRYVKAAWALFVLMCLLDIVVWSIYVAIAFIGGSEWLSNVASHFENTESAVGSLVQILILLAIVSIGIGILRVGDAQKKGWMKALSIAVYVLAAILVVLVVSAWAVMLASLTTSYTWYDWAYWNGNSIDEFVDFLNSSYYIYLAECSNKIIFTALVLLFVASLAALAFSVYVLLTTRKHTQPEHRLIKPATYLVIASLCWLFRCCYRMADFVENIGFTVRHEFFGSGTQGERDVFKASITRVFLSMFFSFYLTFAILVLLYCLGRTKAKKGGLWTSNTPSVAPGTQAVYDPTRQQQAQSYYGPPPMMMHPQQQWQQWGPQPQMQYMPNQQLPQQQQQQQQQQQPISQQAPQLPNPAVLTPQPTGSTSAAAPETADRSAAPAAAAVAPTTVSEQSTPEGTPAAPAVHDTPSATVAGPSSAAGPSSSAAPTAHHTELPARRMTPPAEELPGSSK